MEIVTVFLVAIATSLIKGWIRPKWGENGVHIFTFSIAVVITFVWQYAEANTSFMAALEQGIGYAAAAITLYEVLLKKFEFFKASDILGRRIERGL